jgi:hypothetical protein
MTLASEQVSLLTSVGENLKKYSMQCHGIFLIYSFSMWKTLDDMVEYAMPC